MKSKRQKTGIGMKALTRKTLLTRLSVFLAQVRSGKKFKQTTKRNQANISFVSRQ